MVDGLHAPDVTDVVIVADYAYVAGGAEKVAIQSAIGLADRGICVHYFAAIGKPTEELTSHERITAHSLEQSKVKESASKVKAALLMIRNPEAADRLSQVLSKLNAKTTVVHFHSFMGGLSASVVLAAKEAGFKTLYTAHDYGLACPQQSFFDNSRHEICHLKPLSMACCMRPCTGRGFAFKSAVTLRAISNRKKRLSEAFDAFAFVSEFSGNIIRPFLPKRSVRWVRNPIDTVDQGPRLLTPEAPFLFVGRLTMEKDARTFLEACRLASVKARVVGDGPEKATLMARYPEAEFLPWMNSSDVSDVMRTSRALVFPSIWYEASPLVPYEAVANGLPVLAANANAARETVESLRCGAIFEAGDAKDLASKLEMLKDDAVCERYGHHGYEAYWENPMTLDSHVDALVSYYCNILGGSR